MVHYGWLVDGTEANLLVIIVYLKPVRNINDALNLAVFIAAAYLILGSMHWHL